MGQCHHRNRDPAGVASPPITEKKNWVELTFALSLTGLLSHLESNICKTQDQSHSYTTPLFTGHGENFQGGKPSI